MNGYSNILFDLDGTLIDSKPGVISSVKKAAKELGFSLPPEEELDSFMGPPLSQCFTEVCGLDKELVANAVRIFRGYYEGGGIYDAKPYDGIPELLSALRRDGRRLGVATSKNERFAKVVLSHCGLLEFFDSVAGAPEGIGVQWTKQDSVQKAMDGLSADRELTVLVGDRRFDAAGAAGAGIGSIGVLFGYGSREELAQCGFEALAPDTEVLLALIRKGS